MKRIGIILVILAAIAPGASAFDRATPTLRIVTRNPLVVSGTHFRAAERVTIKTVDVRRVVRTTALGSFRANLGALSSDRCSFLITASGARGDHATLAARAMCAPSSTA